MQISPTGNATAALKRLVIGRAITSFTTNFERRRERGFAPEVIVTIQGQDELAVERARRQVRTALEPFMRNVAITVRTEPEGRRSV